MKKACVLGAGGAIGVPLCRELSRKGFDVTGITLCSPRPVCLGECRWAQASDPVAALPDGGPWDAIFDLRASRGRDVVPYLETCRDLTRHWIHASSIYVYRRLSESWCDPDPSAFLPNPVREETFCRPAGAYGTGKLECELAWRAAHVRNGAPATIVRLPFIIGPGDRLRRASHYANLIRRNGHVSLPGGGARRVPVLFADDAARALVALVDHPDVSGAVLNVAVGRTVTLREHLGALAHALSLPVRFSDCGSPSAGQVLPPLCFPMDLVLDTTRWERLGLQVEPTNLAEGWREAA